MGSPDFAMAVAAALLIGFAAGAELDLIVAATARHVPVRTLPGVGYHRVGYTNLQNFYTVFGRNFSGNPAPISHFFQGSVAEAAFHATVVSSLFCEGTGLSPVFMSMKQPVP